MESTGERSRIATILGTRPEIIKLSPLLPRLDALYDHMLIHTGQHYDDQMDAAFFRELALRMPDYNLGTGPAAAGQLGRMLRGIEELLSTCPPDLVLVQGDTNSTLAGGLAAAQLGVPVAHLEAGCRSFNRSMPEERNRIIVDHISALCLAPDDIAAKHLEREGIGDGRVHIVGSTGVDACMRCVALPTTRDVLLELGLARGQFLVATIHRAENTSPERLAMLLAALVDLGQTWPVIFPVHPRTAKVLAGWRPPTGVQLIEPLGYAAMLQLVRGARALLTDSGGLQEEAAVLGTPTFILRDETEWQAFVDAGHHLLVGTNTDRIVATVRQTLVDGLQEQRMRRPIGLDRSGASERALAALSGFLTSVTEDETGWMHHGSTYGNSRVPIGGLPSNRERIRVTPA